MSEKTSLSYVPSQEEDDAKAVISKWLEEATGQSEAPRVAGYRMAIQIYIRPEEIKVVTDKDGQVKTLYLPHQSTDNDKYSSVVGLVLAVGPQAYKGIDRDGAPRYPEGPWCRPGDWIVFPRYEAMIVEYKGLPIAIINDDQVIMTVEKPTDVAPVKRDFRV